MHADLLCISSVCMYYLCYVHMVCKQLFSFAAFEMRSEQTNSFLGTDRHKLSADSRLASLDHKINLHIKSDSKDGSSNIKDYLKEMIQFYDVEQEDISDSEEESPEAIRTCSHKTANVVTCNGSEMIREQCALNGKEEYMYDWYYLKHCPKEDVDNL